jgi:hypothetical protein
MASITKRAASLPVRRSGPSPKLVKVQTQLASLRKRAASTGRDNQEMLAGVATAAAFATIEQKMFKKGEKLPTVMGLDPALVYGTVAYLFGKKLAAGKNGKLIEAAGSGLLSYAAGRSVYRGSVKVDSVKGLDDDVTDDD